VITGLNLADLLKLAFEEIFFLLIGLEDMRSKQMKAYNISLALTIKVRSCKEDLDAQKWVNMPNIP
jgi:hypothetical protein